MAELHSVEISAQPLERFTELLGEQAVARARAVAEAMSERLAGRVLWNVNSTAVGGGVAEMLQPLLRYTRGVGIDTRWLVIDGNPDFFRVTKRLHHALHGSAGDGSPLDESARRIYETTLQENAIELAARMRPRDFALLHDPQTAGLAPHLVRAGLHVVWRCHIGQERPSEQLKAGWSFLAPYLKEVPAFVFSRETYIPAQCDHGKSTVIQPSIDPFSAKNRELDEATIHTALVHTGLVEGPPPEPAPHEFLREDGTPGRIERRADVVRLGRAPTWQTPLVVQVSRWDTLKDPIGVMRGFATLVDRQGPAQAQLVLAGPNVSGVSDDPEGADVLNRTIEVWRGLPHAVRNRIHIASLPTADVEENAIIVNALQRHASVVVQKSLEEGFGLTVTEAMWKGRPVLASAVGGIQDQIEHGKNGVLLDDPTDSDAFATALRDLLEHPDAAARMGNAARERVRERFLGIRHLLDYARLLESIDRQV
jgi:trehalose synthase